MTEEKKEVQPLDAFGVSEEELEKTKLDHYPALDINQGESVRIRFLDKTPKDIEIPEDKQKFGQTHTKVISVESIDTNEKFTLWLSAKTLRQKVAKVAQQYDFDLTKSPGICLGREMFKSEKYGDVLGYTLTEVQEEVVE